MTIEERAKKYSPNNKEFQECYIDACFEQKKIDIEKACEWMKNNYLQHYHKLIIKDFKKAMEA